MKASVTRAEQGAGGLGATGTGREMGLGYRQLPWLWLWLQAGWIAGESGVRAGGLAFAIKAAGGGVLGTRGWSEGEKQLDSVLKMALEGLLSAGCGVRGHWQ